MTFWALAKKVKGHKRNLAMNLFSKTWLYILVAGSSLGRRVDKTLKLKHIIKLVPDVLWRRAWCGLRSWPRQILPVYFSRYLENWARKSEFYYNNNISVDEPKSFNIHPSCAAVQRMWLLVVNKRTKLLVRGGVGLWTMLKSIY